MHLLNFPKDVYQPWIKGSHDGKAERNYTNSDISCIYYIPGASVFPPSSDVIVPTNCTPAPARLIFRNASA